MYRTLIVTDDAEQLENTDLDVISFAQYLADFPRINEPKTRVINLCNTTHYLSQGYYCSLLAEARQHKVLPSVNVINDLRISEVENDEFQKLSITSTKELLSLHEQSVFVYFGQSKNPLLTTLAAQAFKRFPCPILRLTMQVSDTIGFAQCSSVGLSELSSVQKSTFTQGLIEFTQQQWRTKPSRKKSRWDMAILINPNEVTPPSNERAIKLFVQAAEKVGFQADVVTRLHTRDVGHYDALFIRETTAIDHHTYRLARAAEREGLVVMDDTQSILRCCNKVFLQDAFTYQHVPAPKSEFVASADASTSAELIRGLGLPLILKLPESSFSRGVYKVDSQQALQQKLAEMLRTSALVLVQEYIYTDYDWRIGMLGGKPIYACKYFMARNHWQIYHHNGDKVDSGGFVTMPTFEVPKEVLHAAMKASKSIGLGLYGVDIKQRGKQVYVIEVNDNPSIDAGVEDNYLEKELYLLIMQEFADRLELRGR
jgi:glutathione synthase/RimK-type ligase-like ATP-grasp enzyme